MHVLLTPSPVTSSPTLVPGVACGQERSMGTLLSSPGSSHAPPSPHVPTMKRIRRWERIQRERLRSSAAPQCSCPQHAIAARTRRGPHPLPRPRCSRPPPRRRLPPPPFSLGSPVPSSAAPQPPRLCNSCPRLRLGAGGGVAWEAPRPVPASRRQGSVAAGFAPTSRASLWLSLTGFSLSLAESIDRSPESPHVLCAQDWESACHIVPTVWFTACPPPCSTCLQGEFLEET